MHNKSFSPPAPECDICGKLRSKTNHDKCSKIRQEQHKNDVFPIKRRNLSKKRIEKTTDFFARQSIW